MRSILIKIKWLKIALIVILCGILMGITSYYLNSGFAWLMYVGLFYVVLKYKLNKTLSFFLGLTATSIQGFILFFWIGELTSTYTGAQSNLGFLFALILAIVYAVKTSIPLALFSHLIKSQGSKTKFYYSIIATASAFTISEFIFAYIFKDLHWIFHFIGYTQSTNLYSSQIAEIAGIGGITFILIFCNILIAYSIVDKSYKYFVSSILIIALIHLYGFARLKTINKNHDKIFDIALICDNTPPEIRWNEEEVNNYVEKLLALNLKAVSMNPDLIIWNEGVIPWSFQKEDPFLIEILKQTKNSKAHQLISYFNDNKDGSSYNSAFLFNNEGMLEGRYDKTQLLGGIEKPLWNISGLQLPFFNSNTQNKMAKGKKVHPIKNRIFGNIGIMICNESVSQSAASKLAAQGSSFLVLMANDNWFVNTQLLFHHFYVTRIRAIETRKGIIINNNMGYCGYIESSGKLKSIHVSQDDEVITIQANSDTNISNIKYRIWIFNILSVLILILIIFKSTAYENT